MSDKANNALAELAQACDRLRLATDEPCKIPHLTAHRVDLLAPIGKRVKA